MKTKTPRFFFLLLAASAVIPVLVAAAPQSAPAAPPARMKLDANGDGVVDRAEAAKFPRLAERFDQLDRNKDGRITADERPARADGEKRRVRKIVIKRDGMGGMGMRRLDADKDGRISRAEADKAPRMAEHFARMDANKDGFLDRADREAKMRERRDQWFAQADGNRDGQISRAEFDAAHAKRMAERQKRMEARRAAKP